MYPITHGQIWIILLFSYLTLRVCEGVDCPRDDGRIEQGRSCRDRCRFNSHCTGQETCNCDDACGMSCFDKSEICVVPQLKNGRVSRQSSPLTSYGTMIQYQCNVGYKLTNTEPRTCRSDGKWSGTMPVCTPILCSHPPKIKHGHFTPMKHEWPFNSYVFYYCDNNFHFDSITGTKFRIHCNADGKWDGTVPACAENKVIVGGKAPFAYCKSPSPIANGWIDTSDNGGSRDEWLPNDVVTYNCRQKYELASGSKIRVCTVDGSWTGTQPRCVLKIKTSTANPGYCNSPQNVDNGWIENDRNWGDESEHQSMPLDNEDVPESEIEIRWRTNDVIVYRCKREYELVGGSKRRVCTSGGTWTGQQPRCITQKVTDPLCPNPTPIFGGFITPSGKTTWKSGDSYTLQCDLGYQPVPTNSATCRNDGTWSIQSLQCELIPTYCENPFQISNGWFESAQKPPWKVASVITYRCRDGFNLVGNSRLTCDAQGKWYGLLPTCKAEVRCSSPVVFNGKVWPGSKSEWIPSDTFSITCNEGYEPPSPNFATCGNNGFWSPTSLSCKLTTYCNSPVQISNGWFESAQKPPWKVASVITYRCWNGFDLIGNSQLTCNDQGKWHGSLPACIAKVRCSSPLAFNGRVSPETKREWKPSDTFSITCNEGYESPSPSFSTCGENGFWSPTSLTCKLRPPTVHCQSPEKVENGWIVIVQKSHSLTVWLPNDVIIYKCKTGYMLVDGNERRVCLASGEWAGITPTCTFKTRFCESPVIENGFYSPTGPKMWRFGYSLTVQCFKGFEPPSPNVAKCQANGTWSIPLVCTKKMQGFCQSPPKIENGWIENVRNIGQSDVAHTQGEFVLEAGGNIISTQRRVRWLTDDVIKYNCKSGYELKGGDERRVCTSDGTWTGTDPKCSSIQQAPTSHCPSPPVIENGWIERDRNVGEDVPSQESSFESAPSQNLRIRVRWVENDVIVYKCKNGFELFGESERRVCTKTGSWTGDQPSCRMRKNDGKCGLWRKLSSGVFYAVTKRKETFVRASESCERMGGSLATSILRNRYTFREVFDPDKELFGERYWIGLTDIEKETGWKWIDGVEMSLATVLRRFYYKDVYWGDERDCAYVIADLSKEWRAGDCVTDEHFALCQKDWCEMLDWKQSAFPRGFEAAKFDGPVSPSDAERRCKQLGGWLINSYEVKGDFYVNPDMLPSQSEELRGRGLFTAIAFLSSLATIYETVKEWVYPEKVVTLNESEVTVAEVVTESLPSKEKIRSERSAGDDDVGDFICERHSELPAQASDNTASHGFDMNANHDTSIHIETPEGRSSSNSVDVKTLHASGDEVAVIVPIIPGPNETNTSESVGENSCEPNPCLNGCECEPSALYGYDCIRRTEQQYIGHKCEFESPKVTCGHDAIEVTLFAGVIREMDNGDGDGIMYVAPNDIAAKNISNIKERCLFGPAEIEDVFEVVIPFPYDSCGTIPERDIDNKIKFSNTIWFNRIFADVDVTVHSSVVEFSCSYLDTYKMTSLVDAICCPTPPLITSNGVFKFRSTMWTDPPGENGSTTLPNGKLRTRVHAANGVVMYRVGEMLYLTVEMTSDFGKNSSLIPTLKTCWISPSMESRFPNLPKGDLQLYPSEDAQLVNIYGPINTPSAVHFGFQLINAKKSTRVYLHCQIQVMQKRTRRSSDDGISKESGFSLVTKGPIAFVPEPNMENSGKDDDYDHAAQQQIVGVSIFGILFLLLLIACCLVHVRHLHEREQIDINRNLRMDRFSSSSKHSSVSTVSSVVS